ncbi:hypothetical protein DNTS_027640, partial [Danionella cerebrum]
GLHRLFTAHEVQTPVSEVTVLDVLPEVQSGSLIDRFLRNGMNANVLQSVQGGPQSSPKLPSALTSLTSSVQRGSSGEFSHSQDENRLSHFQVDQSSRGRIPSTGSTGPKTGSSTSTVQGSSVTSGSAQHQDLQSPIAQEFVSPFDRLPSSTSRGTSSQSTLVQSSRRHFPSTGSTAPEAGFSTSTMQGSSVYSGSAQLQDPQSPIAQEFVNPFKRPFSTIGGISSYSTVDQSSGRIPSTGSTGPKTGSSISTVQENSVTSGSAQHSDPQSPITQEFISPFDRLPSSTSRGTSSQSTLVQSSRRHFPSTGSTAPEAGFSTSTMQGSSVYSGSAQLQDPHSPIAQEFVNPFKRPFLTTGVDQSSRRHFPSTGSTGPKTGSSTSTIQGSSVTSGSAQLQDPQSPIAQESVSPLERLPSSTSRDISSHSAVVLSSSRHFPSTGSTTPEGGFYTSTIQGSGVYGGSAQLQDPQSPLAQEFVDPFERPFSTTGGISSYSTIDQSLMRHYPSTISTGSQDGSSSSTMQGTSVYSGSAQPQSPIAQESVSPFERLPSSTYRGISSHSAVALSSSSHFPSTSSSGPETESSLTIQGSSVASGSAQLQDSQSPIAQKFVYAIKQPTSITGGISSHSTGVQSSREHFPSTSSTGSDTGSPTSTIQESSVYSESAQLQDPQSPIAQEFVNPFERPFSTTGGISSFSTIDQSLRRHYPSTVSTGSQEGSSSSTMQGNSVYSGSAQPQGPQSPIAQVFVSPFERLPSSTTKVTSSLSTVVQSSRRHFPSTSSIGPETEPSSAMQGSSVFSGLAQLQDPQSPIAQEFVSKIQGCTFPPQAALAQRPDPLPQPFKKVVSIVDQPSFKILKVLLLKCSYPPLKVYPHPPLEVSKIQGCTFPPQAALAQRPDPLPQPFKKVVSIVDQPSFKILKVLLLKCSYPPLKVYPHPPLEESKVQGCTFPPQAALAQRPDPLPQPFKKVVVSIVDQPSFKTLKVLLLKWSYPPLKVYPHPPLEILPINNDSQGFKEANSPNRQPRVGSLSSLHIAILAPKPFKAIGFNPCLWHWIPYYLSSARKHILHWTNPTSRQFEHILLKKKERPVGSVKPPGVSSTFENEFMPTGRFGQSSTEKDSSFSPSYGTLPESTNPLNQKTTTSDHRHLQNSDKKWQEASNREHAILRYLGDQVPLNCSPEIELQQEKDDQRIELCLLHPLECFLFGEEPSSGLEKLLQQNSSSSTQQCGLVFKEGETIYSCRDCAIDPTCVLCIGCFQKSVHKSHHYKMHTSSGGGFCDCGDIEAWKTGPCCSQHDPFSSVSMETDECSMDPGLQERARMLFQLLLRYTSEMLVWEELSRLPEELKPKVEEDSFFCVLYNDEHHSHDHVVYALQRVIGCDQNQAQIITALIDKEGRRAVKRGSFESCQQAKDKFVRNSEDIVQKPLRVEVIHTAVLAHQSFALRLVGFRQLFCQVALEPENDGLCLISRLMLHDAKLYKGARKVIHELIFSSLMMDTEYKRQLAMKFTEHYKQIQEDFISDYHQRKISITAMSVQIFTVPTLARQLIEEGSVLKVIIDTVLALLLEHVDVNNRFHFQNHISDKFFRVQAIFNDLRYILISKPSGMEEVKRQFGHHVEVEPEIEAGFSLQFQCSHTLGMFEDWCSSDERVLLLAFKDCLSVLMSCTNQPFNREPKDVYMCKRILNVRLYRVSKEPVSIHLPISRLLAGLYVLLCQTGAIQHLSDFVDPAQLNFLELAEQPLRCVALAAQVCADLWCRNGLSFINQVYCYQSAKCRNKMFDKDIVMLQIAASKMDPNQFLIFLVLKFELYDYLNRNGSSERYVPGISNVTKEEVIMREVIHLLYIEPMPHSSLVYSFPENAEEVQKKRRIQEGSDYSLHPPVPPLFTPEFSSIVNILCCDVFFLITRRVIQKALEDRFNYWTEPMLQRVLHLIGQALLEEKRQLESSSSSEEVTFDFKAGREFKVSLLQFLNTLKSVPYLKALHDMITWNLQMFEVVKSLREKSGPVASFTMDHSKSEESLQDREKVERKRKADAAKAHRQKIMAQMTSLQKNFIESNKMIYENIPESSSQSNPTASLQRVAVGPRKGASSSVWERLTCILCQEEEEVQPQGPAIVFTACVQRSTVLTQIRGKPLIVGADHYPLFMPSDLAVGTHTGSCGHVMHAACWQKYFEAVQNTTRNRLHMELIIDLENGEYLCPLCKSLCNTVIPLIPFGSCSLNNDSAEVVGQHLTLENWIHVICSRIRGLRRTWEGDNNREAAEPFDEGQAEFRSILSFGVQESLSFSGSITEMLGVFASTVHRVGLQTPPNELCPYVPVMTWNTCAYTIQAIENMLQEEDKAIFGSLNDRQLSGSRALVECSAAERMKSKQSEIQKYFAEMLSVLVPVHSADNTPSILDLDFFHLLVGLTLSIPALYQEEFLDLQPSAVSTAFNHLHLLHLITMGHMVQIVLASQDCSVAGVIEEGDEALAAAEFFSIVSLYTDGLWPGTSTCSVESVKRAIVPFLRCAALFFHLLTGVAPPEELSTPAESPDSQLPLLCSYLSLPSNLFQLFQEHRDLTNSLLKRHPRKRNQLIDLPKDYSELLNQASQFRCPNSSDDKRKHPTLCLLCGEMLCSQSSCCQTKINGEVVGACTAHAALCGAGLGLFLRVRVCQVILVSSKTRGSSYPSPYLDEYGETDPQLRRGNPLHLCEERYQKLALMWKQHGVLEKIAHSLERQNVNFPFDWQML